MPLIDDYVGGRSADDAEQFAFSVAHLVKDHYPMNEVPIDVKNQCDALISLGKLLKEEANRLVKRLASLGVEKS